MKTRPEQSPAPPPMPADVRAQLVDLFAQALVKDLRRDGVLPELRTSGAIASVDDSVSEPPQALEPPDTCRAR